jgi:hypothetical protein
MLYSESVLVNTVKNVGFMGPYPKQDKLDVSML